MYLKIFFLTVVFITSSLGFCQEKILTQKEVFEIYKKGHTYFKNADFENSLKTLRIALYHSIKINNDSLTSSIYNRIGRNFGELSEDKKALLYFDKALYYAIKANNKESELSILINIGNMNTFDTPEGLKKGIKQYKEALLLSEKLNDTATNVVINMNIAMTLFDNNKFDEGFPNLQYVNRYFQKYGYSSFIPSVAMLNGKYFSSKNKNFEAKSFFEKGIKSSNKVVLKEDKEDLYEEYSTFLFKTENFKEAYKNLIISNNIKEELFNDKKIKKANIAGINFEIDEYKREISKIESEKLEQAKQLKSSNTINYLTIAVAGILGLLLFAVYRNIRFKNKSNAKLIDANLKLQEAKDIAEEATKVKSQFVSTITHELRTPLYGVIGMTDILQDENKDLVNNPSLKSLKYSAQYLLSLVNDILKINKIEENSTSLDRNNIDLEYELEAITNALSFLVHKNNNSIFFKIEKAIPKNLIGDKLRLTQILINLIGNALKFTKNGIVTIDVSLNKIVKKIYFIEFKIIDTGPGIAIEDQERIFEKFVQVSRKEEDYQGTGLGLSIVKKLLDLFNSRINIESKIGEGTTFLFIIGFEKDDELSNQILVSSSIEIPERQNFKILVVEDNKINQMVSKKIIEKSLGSCLIANDGFEAISFLEKNNFDIILMDINMPGIDGYETTMRIRKLGKTTPIIALTASSKDQIKEKVLQSGMNDIIVKPFDPLVLYQTIKKILE